MPSSIIIGGGWAGLMCAYTLAKRGHDVTILEAAPQLGGRARSVDFAGHVVDNGQHVCLGAYRTLRELLVELNIKEESVFNILPLQLNLNAQSNLKIKFPKFHAPLHVMWGFLTAENLSWSGKIQVLRFCQHLNKVNFTIDQDTDLRTYLKNYHQSDYIIKYIWEPIALATMTTPIALASTQVFLNILKLCFTNLPSDCNWYIPNTDLSNLLPNKLEQQLINLGCKIVKSQVINRIEFTNQLCTNICSKSENWRADNIIIATPPWAAAALLQPHSELHATHAKLSALRPQPILTIYYEFSAAINLPYPIVGMLDTIGQWIFDRKSVGQANMLSVIISGPGQHQNLDHTQLALTVLQDIRTKLPNLPSLIQHKVINEKRAAFSCEFTNQPLRPQPYTEIRNLWLAGDYVQTGLPATLEGALLSGKQTGELING